VSGPGDVDDVEIVFLDDPVEVHIDEVEARRRAPVSEQPGLDVLRFEGLAEQRVVVEVEAQVG
jgi:hypothetical protein